MHCWNRNPTSDRGRLKIEMSDAEKQTIPVLPNLCPGFRDFLGRHCCETLDSGFKIELEGAMMHLRSGPSLKQARTIKDLTSRSRSSNPRFKQPGWTLCGVSYSYGKRFIVAKRLGARPTA